MSASGPDRQQCPGCRRTIFDTFGRLRLIGWAISGKPLNCPHCEAPLSVTRGPWFTMAGGLIAASALLLLAHGGLVSLREAARLGFFALFISISGYGGLAFRVKQINAQIEK